MGPASSFSLTGMLYNGQWGNEPIVTVKKHCFEWHVCVKEKAHLKRIVAVCESKELADILVEALKQKGYPEDGMISGKREILNATNSGL